MADAEGPVLVLDLRGLACPDPVLRARTAMRELPDDGVLVLECTDPLTVIDVPLFVRQNRHRLIGHERDGELFIYRIARI